MHLAHRAYVLVLLTAVMGIAAIWSSEPGLADLWRIPAGLLLLGLALEGCLGRRMPVAVAPAPAPRAFLGAPPPAALVFPHAFARPPAAKHTPPSPPAPDPPGR